VGLRDLIPLTNAATVAGRKAGLARVPHTRNPYRLTAPHARRHFAWLRGWQQGRTERIQQRKAVLADGLVF